MAHRFNKKLTAYFMAKYILLELIGQQCESCETQSYATVGQIYSMKPKNIFFNEIRTVGLFCRQSLDTAYPNSIPCNFYTTLAFLARFAALSLFT